MKKKLLLSGLGGSLFPYLHYQLADKYDLYYVDSNECLTFVYPEFNFFKAPKVIDKTYFPFIKEIIEKNNIDFYIPLIDEEIIDAKKLEGFNNVTIISPSIQFCSLCLNKYSLMKELQKHRISFIESYIGDNFTYDPGNTYFVKPIVGRGSRGIKKITSQKQLDAYYILEGYKPNEILIQEYVEGTEYSIGATVNNLNQLLLVSIRKIAEKRGITQIATTEKNDLLFSLVEDVVNKLMPYGSINIQLFVTPDNKSKIFEINPRFSTTSIMNYAAGINEIDYLIRHLNKDCSSNQVMQPKENITLYRRWENIFYEK